MFKKLLVPDRMFDRYGDITPADLASIGVRALLIDIDNTLAPYEQPDPDDEHRAWFAAMAEAGIRCALVSNNDRARVERFNATLGLPAYWKSGKPFGRTMKRIMKLWGVTREETAVLGDQLLTDALAAHGLGLRALIVPPIRDKRTVFVRFKRWLEKPYIRAYRQAHPLEKPLGKEEQ